MYCPHTYAYTQFFNQSLLELLQFGPVEGTFVEQVFTALPVAPTNSAKALKGTEGTDHSQRNVTHLMSYLSH